MENIIHGFTDKTENTPGFEWRKSKTEFLCDGEMIKALYEKIEDILYIEQEGPKPDRAVRVFNFAYNICWQLITIKQKKCYTTLVDGDRNPKVRKLAYTLASVLIAVYGKSDGLNNETKNLLSKNSSNKWFMKLLELAIQHPLTDPNRFFNPQTESQTLIEEEEEEPTKDLDFDKAKDMVVKARKKADKAPRNTTKSQKQEAETDPQKEEKTFVPILETFICKKATAKENLPKLFDGLTHIGWIGKNSKPDDFMDLFSGQLSNGKTIWTKKNGKGELKRLFLKMLNEKFIERPPGIGYLKILQSHFVDPDGNYLTGLNKIYEAKSTKTTLDACIEILKGNHETYQRMISENENAYFDEEELYPSNISPKKYLG